MNSNDGEQIVRKSSKKRLMILIAFGAICTLFFALILFAAFNLKRNVARISAEATSAPEDFRGEFSEGNDVMTSRDYGYDGVKGIVESYRDSASEYAEAYREVASEYAEAYRDAAEKLAEDYEHGDIEGIAEAYRDAAERLAEDYVENAEAYAKSHRQAAKEYAERYSQYVKAWSDEWESKYRQAADDATKAAKADAAEYSDMASQSSEEFKRLAQEYLTEVFEASQGEIASEEARSAAMDKIEALSEEYAQRLKEIAR
ncbi:MAG: hypothetical protein LBU32_30570 [Clostridiales bacterium]|nr:hypothetical protein [Clostridiales bacterium]